MINRTIISITKQMSTREMFGGLNKTVFWDCTFFFE